VCDYLYIYRSTCIGNPSAGHYLIDLKEKGAAGYDAHHHNDQDQRKQRDNFGPQKEVVPPSSWDRRRRSHAWSGFCIWCSHSLVLGFTQEASAFYFKSGFSLRVSCCLQVLPFGPRHHRELRQKKMQGKERVLLNLKRHTELKAASAWEAGSSAW